MSNSEIITLYNCAKMHMRARQLPVSGGDGKLQLIDIFGANCSLELPREHAGSGSKCHIPFGRHRNCHSAC